MDIRVRVLGEFEIEGLSRHELGSRKARTLLKILSVARGRPVAVDQLVEHLWPDEEEAPQRPEEQVAVLVSRLRAVLGAERLVRTDAGYRLVTDWLDLDALEDLVNAAARRLSAGSYALARTAAEAGLALQRGPVLADEPDSAWVTGERVAAERLLAEARLIAARAALNAGDATAAADFGAASLEHSPYDEAMLRLIMEAHAAAGRPALAIDAYGRARQRLIDELGVEPGPETESVYLRVLRQESSSGERQASSFVERGRSVLPGRDTELAALDAALERAATGHVELMLVEGEAGIGKSRLLEVWGGNTDAAGVRVLRARCDELERSLPLQPLADALDGYLRKLATGAAVLTLLGPEHPLLAPLLRACPPPSQHIQLDPVGGQATLFAALLSVFERLAASAPVVLLLDDVHLADRATLAWLHFAARRGAAVRLLMVGALRTEESVQLPQARRLRLGPLDLAAARLVVSDARAAELHARSGGHPLFLVELAAVDDGALPTSLREAIGARCERAGADASLTLRTAALLGPTVDLELLVAVAKRPPLDLLGHLEEGARRGLLEERGSTFVFRHELVREALASATGAARTLLVHGEAARALMVRPNVEPLEVAYHAHQGGDHELAAVAYANAAIQAGERYDHVESERLLNLAIELSDAPPRRLQRARTRLLRGDLPGAEADALVAFEGGAGGAALETAGWAAYYRRDLAAAERYADAGTRTSAGADRAACLALGGEVRHSIGRLTEAEAQLEEALRTADSGTGAFAATVYLASVRRHQGRPREALELIGQPSRRPPMPDLQLAPMTAHMVAVHARGALGEAAAALQAISAWEEAMERQGASRFKGRPANYKAWVLRALGACEEADELNRRAVDEARGLGTGEAEAHALLDLADGQLRLGDLDAAAQHLDAVAPLQVRQHANRWRHELRYRLLRSRLAMALRSVEDAYTSASRLNQDARGMGVLRYADLARLLEIQAAADLGMPIEHESIEVVLQRLPAHSGLEAWWLTAEVAAATNTDRFWSLAEAYADKLAAHSGEYTDAFRDYAGAHLERIKRIAAGLHSFRPA